MSKNHMEEVAKLLGVELRDIFKVVNIHNNIKNENYFRLTKKGLEISRGSDHWWRGTAPSILEGLMRGEYKIITSPWKPKINEVYYVPCIQPDDSCMWTKRLWLNHKRDNKLYQLGLVCKTMEKAIAMTKKMLAIAEEEENNG